MKTFRVIRQPVCTKNLTPNVVVMEPAEKRL
jgi:hypothetical protein